MNEDFGGKQAAIANAVGRPANYISRILNGSKQLGEDLVREFEESLKKPDYWFDGMNSSGNWPFSAPYELYDGLDDTKKHELDIMVKAYIAGALPTKSKEQAA
ncbi:hypothetical protein EV686_11096 [Paracandidimonas soli]|uniref:Uncharacterized protein n=2 Tax=Paracandidimonas soli TaxID=1917182 RepID=A0A4R3UTY7_9BURK|nr:hypothetical protein EV686_11096 [Paracandidimonas soli]